MIYDKPAAYLPHSAPMVLLENVISVTPESARCDVVVAAQGVLGRFLDKNGNLPGWYAIELLAQTVGVWSGWHQQQNQVSQPAVGLLLGGRGIKCSSPAFPAGARLSVTVRLQLKDDNIGSFEGEISAGDISLATGRITTYQPAFDELTALFQRDCYCH